MMTVLPTSYLYPPDMTDEQIQDLAQLEILYSKPASARFIDGLSNLAFSGGHQGRIEAEKLSKIAQLFLNHNKELVLDYNKKSIPGKSSVIVGEDYYGVESQDVKKLRKFIKLYSKSTGKKIIDGIGNALCGGNFGRSDALDLIRIIKNVRVINTILYEQQQEIEKVRLRASSQPIIQTNPKPAPFYFR